MENAADDGGDGGSSLFEGMVLFIPPSDPSPAALPTPPSPAAKSPAHTPAAVPDPLDEDLFSELTLVQSLPQPQLQLQPQEQPSSRPVLPRSISGQISRKKKRAFRIGYARDSPASGYHQSPVVSSLEPAASDDASSSDLAPPGSAPREIRVSDSAAAAASVSSRLPSVDDSDGCGSSEVDVSSVSSDRTDALPALTACEVPAGELKDDVLTVEEDIAGEGIASQSLDGPTLEDLPESGQGCSDQELPLPLDAFATIEARLAAVKAQISSKLDTIRCRASDVMVNRKDVGAKRRKVSERFASVSARHKELEEELNKACEAEDFEKAESISENILSIEKEKDELLVALRDSELEYDSVEMEMQKVLEMHIEAEEESAALLQQFSKDAADFADSVRQKLDESSSERMEEWQISMEILETEKIAMDVESELVLAARSDLEKSIEHLVVEDKRKQAALKSKGDLLAEELAELLRLVKLKEEEISLNNSQIQEVEKTISIITAEYQETQSSLDTKLADLELAQSKIDEEITSLVTKRKENDKSISLADDKRLQLKLIASASTDEAKACLDLACLRRNLASSFLKSREDRINLAKMEEKITDEIQALKQDNAQARACLQEFSARRAYIQQEISTLKQRTAFIDKRGPELEAEKRAAAIARNFKEAGRIAAEAKALSTEKEETDSKLNKALAELVEVEKDVAETTAKLQQNETLVLQKEREFAEAACKRLQLISAAARAERDAAIEIGDTEEGDILLKEAESAESKAKELQQSFELPQLAVNDDGLPPSAISIAFITNMNGQHLREIASRLGQC